MQGFHDAFICDPVSGALTLLALRDFLVGLIGSPSQRKERARHESALYRRPKENMSHNYLRERGRQQDTSFL